MGHSKTAFSQLGHSTTALSQLGHSKAMISQLGHSKTALSKLLGHSKTAFSQLGHSKVMISRNRCKGCRNRPVRAWCSCCKAKGMWRSWMHSMRSPAWLRLAVCNFYLSCVHTDYSSLLAVQVPHETMLTMFCVLLRELSCSFAHMS